MVSAYISYRSSTIHYDLLNRGHQIVLCFHGYGERSSSFDFLREYCGDDLSLIAIDLPFHGKTDWKEGLNFSVEDLQYIVNLVLQDNFREEELTEAKFILLGFSMGARIALCLYEAAPAHFSRLVLLAPDGIKTNGWYWLATQTSIGNRLFRSALKHPGWLRGSLRLLKKLRLVHANKTKFVAYSIAKEEQRRLLYDRWTALRKLKPHITRIRSLIKQNKTTVRLVYGKSDPVMLAEKSRQFKKGIEDLCLITVIDSGHQVLHPKNRVAIASALRN